jgi:acetyl esterase/lipase
VSGKELRHAIALEAELQQLVTAAPDIARARESVRAAVLERIRKTVPDDIRVEAADAPGLRGEWVDAPLESDDRVAIFVHGGAWTFGSPAESRELAARIARSSQASVLSLSYRVAPEHPFPAALDDVVAAFRALVADGGDPRQIALVGESTGAALALAAAIALRDAGEPLPGAIAALSPVTDLTARDEAPGGDPVKAWQAIARGAAAWRGELAADDPRVSPIFAELAGLPALLIQAGTADPVLGQTRRFVERARERGVDVTYREWDGMIHRWQAYPHIYDAGRATNQVGDYLLQRLGPGYVPVPRAA